MTPSILNDTSADLHKRNEEARRLLKYLCKCALEAGGRPFSISAKPLVLSGADLSYDEYGRAKGRLLQKHLAEHMTMAGMTITDYGLRVGEDDDLLEEELPIARRERRAVTKEPGPVTAEALLALRNTLAQVVKDPVLAFIVNRDAIELEVAHQQGLRKSTAMLAGSIAEAVLLDVCERNTPVAKTYMKVAADFPAKASLDKLIEIATGEGLLENLTETFAKAVTNYRDLIHPDRERRERPTVDAGMADILLLLLGRIVTNVCAAQEDGRVAAYEAKVV